MTRLKKIQIFLIKKFFGLFFLSLSCLFFVSLISYDANDPGFGIAANNNNINNWLGIFGAQISSFFLVFYGYISYLFCLYFLITSIKLIIGKAANHIFLKFLSLIVGMSGFTFVLTILDRDSGLIGLFLKNIIYNYFDNISNSLLVFWTICIITLIISVILIYLSLSTKLNFFLKIILKILKISYFFIKILKVFTSVFFFFQKKSSRKKVFQKNNYRTEPTIKKSKGVLKKLNKNNELKISNNQYILPTIDLLKTSNEIRSSANNIEKRNIEFGKKLEIILKEYGVEGKIINFKSGPVVTLYEFVPAAGIKTSKVIGLSDDIARAMSSLSTRISSQPGKTSIGIEIPNDKRENVYLGDLIKSEKFSQEKFGLTLALGKNIAGDKKFTDLEKMPHLLIAGTTGSGKSVGINSMIISLLFRFKPSECKLILIDPKMLELSIYEDIPHLLTPVVTNPNKAVFALKWVVREMENRYQLMSSLNVKNIDSFNKKIFNATSNGRKLYREVQTGFDKDTRIPIIEKKEIPLEKMPLIVVIIDEMADLMMVSGKEVENLVQRLAQMARASGIHLIAATQRPSVDVITGTIKANFPSRISFRVASRFDSRTILNEMGAEQLLGSGDMLFLENGANLTRLHGGFVSESEIEAVVQHIKSQSTNETQQDITFEEHNPQSPGLNLGYENKNNDNLYEKAVSIVLDQQKVSTSFIQRYLQIGYNRAARIVEKMEEDGFISEPSHAGKRSVLKKNK